MAGELRVSALKSRQYGRYGYLAGFPKGRAVATVSVNPPSILAGGTGTVDVTLTGAKATRRHRAVFLPHAALEAGLVVTTTAIISNDTVRISITNTSDDTINGDARNWTAHLFSMVP